ncbi:MAG: hypothetical protein IPP25_12935 [Saprospiraceae bacterium]|nr:hypothetical protein [Candidatus Opimibacter skivensis]
MSAKLAVDYSNQLFYTDIEGGFELTYSSSGGIVTSHLSWLCRHINDHQTIGRKSPCGDETLEASLPQMPSQVQRQRTGTIWLIKSSVFIP